ncbi:Malate:quinone oxidoreductase [Actinidia chinensis var. chinensis]|uniref:Malate:quinone oxidoreductase n=1 Tax=Actinidia chinensis var. chinensis TaxID=1590841 RepID=A0A2R6QIX7_ACTCC|nr:Malate:quinone oxidoreductase [Actinidia chinensis var. chinensis]
MSKQSREPTNLKNCRNRRNCGKRRVGIVCGGLLPMDPWSSTIDSQSIASQLFAFSLFPYIGFLYFITESKSAPKLTLFGFYFLLAFVGATIPAGIYAKVHYGTSLSNVDWLHGGAESLLTLTNLFIVMGLREALGQTGDVKAGTSSVASSVEGEKNSSIWVQGKAWLFPFLMY